MCGVILFAFTKNPAMTNVENNIAHYKWKA